MPIASSTSRAPQTGAVPQLWREQAPAHFDLAVPAWVKIVLVAAAAVLAVLFLDQRVAAWCHEHQQSIPDLRRPLAPGAKGYGDAGPELMFLEQWGQGVCSVIVIVGVFLMDPAGRRRAFSIAVACIWTAILTHLLKDIVGRSRPFVAPQSGDGSWVWGGPSMGFTHGAAWGAMPSAHTSAAFALAAALAWYYPRARGLLMALSCITAALRVLHTAHYLSDVIVGMGLGVFVTRSTLALGLSGRTFRYLPAPVRDWWLADWKSGRSPA